MATCRTGCNLLKWLLLAAVVTVPLSGCLGTSEGDTPAAAAPGAPGVVISGSVGDGPVTGATVTVYSNSGDILGAVPSDGNAFFSTTLQVADNQYPLRLVVSGGIDLVTGAEPDFEMVSVMLQPSDQQVNINPFTTLIVSIAENLPGGLNASNVNAALPVVLGELGFGLDTSAVPNPITTPITGSNVADLVKASEALGELVRRTRDLIAATGQPATGDTVLAALAADLTDGVVDGVGAAGADPTVAAVANVASGQVLVEAMSNNLRVGGVIATQVIDQSIISTHAGSGSPQLTDSVVITAQMIQQAQVAIAATQVLDSGAAVANIAAGLASLSPNSSPGTVMTVLPVDTTIALNGAVSLVATASSEEQDAINQVVAAGGIVSPQVPVNTPPVITGSPANSVTVGGAYSFQPSAYDLDGDTLSFVIANKPAWASFHASNGKLSGAPATTDVGNYSGIVISVKDGTATTSLASFSIAVNQAQPQTGSFTLGWVAPATRADGTPLSLSDIDGYRIYYGTKSGVYTSTYDVTDGTATSITISSLPVGTYFIAMTTYDSAGMESAKSAEVVKSIP